MATTVLGSGKAAMKVSPIGFGAMNVTGCYGSKISVEDGVKLLRKAYDLGVRHYDTAQVYQSQNEDGTIYYSESVVGAFLKTLTKEEKEEVTVATKLSPFAPVDSSGKFSFQLYREATLGSIERLGVDAIDLYYFHRMIPSSAGSIQEWMGAAKKLVEEGLIKRVGLSEASPQAVEIAHGIYPITCIEQEWSLFTRDLEEDLVPLCKRLNIGIVSYSPIARGILTTDFKREETKADWRATLPWLNDDNFEHNKKVIEEIQAFAVKKKCSIGQLCIAWVMAKGSVPIPGTTKEKNLEDNMGALKVKLTPEEIQQLGDLGKKIQGPRGDEEYMAHSYKNADVKLEV